MITDERLAEIQTTLRNNGNSIKINTTIDDILQSVEDEFIAKGKEADSETVPSAIKKRATELRTALAPFDPNAGTVEQHQHSRMHGAWVDCNKATSDRAVADGLEVRIVYLPATPEK